MFGIGLDIGTTSICGVLMDSVSGEIKKVENRKNDSWIKSDNLWEKIQDPEIIVNTVFDILNDLMCDSVEAIGVTGQMHGILYYDDKGCAISPLYTWQDGRGNLPYNETTYAEFLSSHTGYGNVTNFYNKENGLIPDNAKGFCTIHDYVVMKLTKRSSALVHSSDGASFGRYDLTKNEYTYKDSLQPETTSKTTVAGHYNNIPVAVAIGDNQASFLGGGCDDSTVLVNVGTGSQISLMTDGEKSVKGLEIRPLSENGFLMVGSSLCGGRAYALLENFFRQVLEMADVKIDSLYDKMASKLDLKSDNSPEFETLFSGTRDNPEKRASITGISIDNFTPYDLVFACMNGISGELFEMYDNAGKKCTRLVGTGNGIRKNEHLKKIIENQFGLKMQIPKFSEEAASGAVIFALTACGKYKNLKEAERIVNYENI